MLMMLRWGEDLTTRYRWGYIEGRKLYDVYVGRLSLITAVMSTTWFAKLLSGFGVPIIDEHK